MIFNKIVGHTGQIQNLKTYFAQIKPTDSRTFLFFGPSGVGKKLTALAAAQTILCTSNNKPCGKCPGCIKVEKNSHPDCLIIKEEGQFIKVENASQIHKFLSMKSYEGGGKIVIIDDAHKLNVQSANSLLKVLEEPPESTFIFLVTSNKGAILPTILSRSIKVHFGSLNVSELKKIFPKASDQVLLESMGRCDRTEELTNETSPVQKKKVFELLADAVQIRTFEAFNRLTELCPDRESTLQSVSYILEFIKKSLALRLGADPAVSPNDRALLDRFSINYSVENLFEFASKTISLEQDILRNVNKNLALEQYWIQTRRLTSSKA